MQGYRRWCSYSAVCCATTAQVGAGAHVAAEQPLGEQPRGQRRAKDPGHRGGGVGGRAGLGQGT
eukprot:1317205-Pyramimonas_sp.AAC.1